jgi:hypothetical protein
MLSDVCVCSSAVPKQGIEELPPSVVVTKQGILRNCLPRLSCPCLHPLSPQPNNAHKNDKFFWLHSALQLLICRTIFSPNS